MLSFDNTLIDNFDDVVELFRRADEAGVDRFAIDTETDGLITTKGYNQIVGVSLAFDTEDGFYIPLRHSVGTNVDPVKFFELLKDFMQDKLVIAHNFKFDGAMLYNEGIDYWDLKLFDTMVADFIYDSSDERHGLKYLSIKRLGYEMTSYEDTTEGENFKDLDPVDCYEYAGTDAVITFGLFEWYITRDEWDDLSYIFSVEMDTTKAVLDLERNRVLMNTARVQEVSNKMSQELEELKEKIEAITGIEKINSSQQWTAYMFDEGRAIYPKRFGKTGSGKLKWTAAVMKYFKDSFEEVKLLLEYKKKYKLLHTYLDNLVKNTYPDNTIKFGLKQTGAETGRFSSPGGVGLVGTKKKSPDGYCGVNAQNIPRSSVLGELFIPRPGHKVISVDWSAQELRVAANVSGERGLIDAFLAGIDGHIATASICLSIPPEEVTKEQRAIGKVLNFALLYQAGPATVCENINKGKADDEKMTEGEAKKLINRYFTNAPTLAEWIDIVKINALDEDNYYRVYDVFGRVRHNKKIVSRIGSGRSINNILSRGERARWERQAVNFNIQGSCATIDKIALYRVAQYARDHKDEVLLLSNIHDEFIFDIKDNSSLQKHCREIEKIMMLEDVLQGDLNWEVPLEAEAEIKDNWRK